MRVLLSLIIIAIINSCGVSGSSGKIATEPPSMHERRDSFTIFSDKTIEKNAAKEIKTYDDLRDTDNLHFNITAYNGIVLVTGEATNARLRNKVISIVRVIPNVRRVYNEMSIGPRESFRSQSNDTYLNTKVNSAIQKINNLPGFDAAMIKVVTENSVIYLMGIVHQAEGNAVAKKIQHVEGVVKIVTLFEYLD